MAERNRQLGGNFTLDDTDIRSAYACTLNLDKHFFLADFGYGHIFDYYFTRFINTRCFHQAPLSHSF
jgi:hypothetical protein